MERRVWGLLAHKRCLRHLKGSTVPTKECSEKKKGGVEVETSGTPTSWGSCDLMGFLRRKE